MSDYIHTHPYGIMYIRVVPSIVSTIRRRSNGSSDTIPKTTITPRYEPHLLLSSLLLLLQLLLLLLMLLLQLSPVLLPAPPLLAGCALV